MIGPVLTVVAIVVVIPVSLMLLGALVSFALGFLLRDDAVDRYQGSELVDLNR